MVEIGATVAIIPARAGSKRLPRKNIRPLGGKPLITWTIEAALMARRLSEIVVTSDDAEILAEARLRGVTTHHRKANLATDAASTVDVMLNVIDWLESRGRHFGTCVLLQPTSPLRNAQDICGAIDLYAAGEGETVISVTEIGIPLGWCGSVNSAGFMTGFKSLSCKEETHLPAYRLNGAIYVFGCARFMYERKYQTERNKAFIIPPERALDIDTERDFRQCEAIIRESSLLRRK